MQSQYREQPRPFAFDDSPYSAHASHHVSDFPLNTPAYPAYDTASSYLVSSSSVGLTEGTSVLTTPLWGLPLMLVIQRQGTTPIVL